MFAGARVDVVARERGWVYVNAGGRCGWLMDRGLRDTGRSVAAVCPDPDALAPERLFAPGSFQRGCGQGCVYPARVVPCADGTAYANFDGTFRDPVGREPVGRGTRGPRVPRYAGVRTGYAGFGVRYLTRDRTAVLIKDARRGGPVWRFMHADCVERVSLLVTGRAIGEFSLRRGVPRAIRALGRRYVRVGCSVSWVRPAVTISFCARVALITRQPIRGSALVHTWTTAARLRLGDRVELLRRLYPTARRFHGSYRLEPGLRAVVTAARVAAFRVSG